MLDMNYDEFIMLVNGAKNALAVSGVSMEVTPITKVNHSYLVVRFGKLGEDNECGIFPQIPMELIFNKFKRNASSRGEITSFLLKEFSDVMNSDNVSSCIVDKEHVAISLKNRKDQIFFKIVNTEANRELLSGLPHREILDLSLFYYVVLGCSNSDGLMTSNISYSTMEFMGFSSESELYEIARENMLRDGADIKPLSNLIGMEDDCPLLFLSNKAGTFGASVMVLNEVLEKCYDYCHGGFYILPSSIDEVLVTPDAEMSVKSLLSIVWDANRRCCDLPKRLSNNVYHYDHVSGLTVAGYSKVQSIKAY